MSCWCRSTVLRIPAVHLGFKTWEEWNAFLNMHNDDFSFDTGWFCGSMCNDYAKYIPGRGMYFEPEDPDDPLPEEDPYDPGTVPGPFLDYFIEHIEPLHSEDRAYHMDDIARPLSQREKKKYLPLYQELFPDFTIEDMEYVHYCRYEWYNGAEPAYKY